MINQSTSQHGTPSSVSMRRLYAASAVSIIALLAGTAWAAPVGIYDIQGTGDQSTMLGSIVTTTGIVTAVRSNGFYIQDAIGDSNVNTSDGIFVLRSTSGLGLTVGAAVEVTGTVQEFFPGGAATGNLSTTQLGGSVTVVTGTTGNALPAASIIGTGGRVAPNQSVTDGIKFYESLEGMRVTVQDAQAVTGRNSFGEIFTVANGGATATGMNSRGGITLNEPTPGQIDYNPERVQIQIDSQLTPSGSATDVKTGDKLGNVTGVMSYNFGNYEIQATQAVQVTAPSALQPESTNLVGSKTQVSIATYNVENLSAVSPDSKFQALAGQIVTNLKKPDIIALQEIQDNSGPTDNGVVDASQTAQKLINAIKAAGGPTYVYVDLPPVNNQDGGAPGSNIRPGYLYNPERVSLVPGSLQKLTDPNLGDGDAFLDSRKPLVGKFLFNGQELTVVNNHFTSKTGSTPIFGTVQPFINEGLAQRIAQALLVREFINLAIAANPDTIPIALGDFNEFQFEDPVKILEGDDFIDMARLLEALEQYTFNFEGNQQLLDHIITSLRWSKSSLFDIVHMNNEFTDPAADHDPSVLLVTVPEPASLAVFGAGLLALTWWRRRQAMDGR
jgi:uncharacterized protein